MATAGETRTVWTSKQRVLPKPVKTAPAVSEELNFEIDPKAMQELLSDLMPNAEEGKTGRNTMCVVSSQTNSPKPSTTRRSSLFGGAMRVKAPVADAGSKRAPVMMTPSRVMAKPKSISTTKTPKGRMNAISHAPDSTVLNFNDCPDFLLAATQGGHAGAKQTPSKPVLAPTAAGTAKTPAKLHTRDFIGRSTEKENSSSIMNATTTPGKAALSKSLSAGLPTTRTPQHQKQDTSTTTASTNLLIDLDDVPATSPAKTYFPIMHVEMPPKPQQSEDKLSTSIFGSTSTDTSSENSASESSKTEFSIFSPIRSQLTSTQSSGSITGVNGSLNPHVAALAECYINTSSAKPLSQSTHIVPTAPGSAVKPPTLFIRASTTMGRLTVSKVDSKPLPSSGIFNNANFDICNLPFPPTPKQDSVSTIDRSASPISIDIQGKEGNTEDSEDATIVIDSSSLQRAITAPSLPLKDSTTVTTTNITIEVVSPRATTVTTTTISSAPPTPASSAAKAPKVRVASADTLPSIAQEDVRASEETTKSEKAKNYDIFGERLRSIATERQSLLNMLQRLQEEENKLIAEYFASIRVNPTEAEQS